MLEVLFNFRAMCKVAGNTRVNVAEAERRKALDDLLSGRAEFEMMDDGVQTNARALDANCPLLGDNKWRAEGFFEGHHDGWALESCCQVDHLELESARTNQSYHSATQ